MLSSPCRSRLRKPAVSTNMARLLIGCEQCSRCRASSLVTKSALLWMTLFVLTSLLLCPLGTDGMGKPPMKPEEKDPTNKPPRTSRPALTFRTTSRRPGRTWPRPPVTQRTPRPPPVQPTRRTSRGHPTHRPPRVSSRSPLTRHPPLTSRRSPNVSLRPPRTRPSTNRPLHSARSASPQPPRPPRPTLSGYSKLFWNGVYCPKGFLNQK